MPVIEVNDLVVAKLLASRPKDLEDVASVLRSKPRGLSISTVRERLRELEQLLDDSTMLRSFEAILEREG